MVSGLMRQSSVSGEIYMEDKYYGFMPQKFAGYEKIAACNFFPVIFLLVFMLFKQWVLS